MRVSADLRDPIAVVWTAAARRCGLRLVRTREAYASYDGQGTLSIAAEADLDPDDHLAQMVLHELCHAMVCGEGATGRIDWGMSVEGLDALEEHATHRVQAALADRHGLRNLVAVTTMWRPYWDALPADPLADGADPAIPLARRAWTLATTGPWAGPIDAALAATAAIRAALQPYTTPEDLWSR